MKMSGWARLASTILLVAFLAGCSRDGSDEAKEVLSGPKTYVGSEQCKMCHLEHYDSWRGTLHSRTIQDVTQNLDAMAATINPEAIRADLRKFEKDLKVPVDDIYIPEVEDLKYTIGVQWKQGNADCSLKITCVPLNFLSLKLNKVLGQCSHFSIKR